MKALGQTIHFLDSLKLKGITLKLDELLTDAEMQKSSYFGFFNTLLSAEVDFLQQENCLPGRRDLFLPH